MRTQRVDDYYKFGCRFHGKLVVVEYLEDAQKDPKWGRFAEGVTYDYIAKAKKLVEEKYGTSFKVLMAIPEYVVEIP